MPARHVLALASAHHARLAAAFATAASLKNSAFRPSTNIRARTARRRLLMKRYMVLLISIMLMNTGCGELGDGEIQMKSLTEFSADASPGATCGNGMVEAGEECDDGNTRSDDGCSAECRYEYCGDGIVQSTLGEQCDDGNYRNDDGCDMFCQIERF
jgi:cysteine-rich repeat protein